MSSTIKNQEELRALLNEKYSKENWKKVTEFVFPNVSYWQEPLDIPFKSDKVETFRQIGNVKLNDGKNLAMFEVHVSEQVNIANNRIELRKLVAPLIDQELNHGVLVIYEQGKDDYRFTFTAKSTEFSDELGDFINTEPDAKRFTYVLGKNETCKTAASRFWELSENKDSATIKVVQDAFSVEKLNIDFFNRYKNIYQDFVQFISGKRFVPEKGKKGKEVLVTLSKASTYYKDVFKKNDVFVRNFVKLLLGRLVFIQFLQKKGWMGLPSTSKHWVNGDKNFLHNLFLSFNKKENFHSKALYQLFHGALNTPNRPNDIFSLTNSRVPYLNGGLFENTDITVNKVDFPEELFAELFDFFSQFNFTIDESDSFEQEVGIDPEMLGHIFENLLEDNKANGTFYTPKNIVKYMCKESLLEYLTTKLNADTKKRRSLEKLIKGKEEERTEDFRFDTEFAPIMIALKEIKICDPAIGSGAFPMGMLMEIFEIVELFCHEKDAMIIWNVDNWEEDKSEVKLNIIQNSIYGVDIEKGAVDIARLRFWLSLVVDELEPRPLPNLDYKIVVGDSLVPKFNNEILEIDWAVKSTPSTKAIALKIEKYLKEIVQVQKEFFDESDLNKKVKLQKHIRLIKIELLINQLSLDKIIYSARKISSGKMFDLTKEEKAAQREIDLKLKSFDKSISKLEKAKTDDDIAINYFDWLIDFPEIINPKVNIGNIGFDIVIANPPYGADIDDYTEYFEEHFPETTKEFKDIYKIFFDLAISKLTKQDGTTCFITPNTFFLQPRYKDLRKYLLKYQIKSLLNLGENVFDAVVPTAISLHKKSDCSSSSDLDFADVSDGSKFSGNIININFQNVKQSLYNETPDSIFVNHYRKLELNESILFDIVDFKDGGINYQRVNVGLKDKGNSDLSDRLLYEGKREKDSHPQYWKGTDIDAYFMNSATNRFVRPNIKLDSNERMILNADYFEIKPKLIWRQTASYPIATIDKKGIWFGRSIQAATIKKEWLPFVSYEYMAALLNSTLMKYFYIKNVQESGRVFPQVKLTKMKPLPVKLLTMKSQEKFVAIVEDIIKNKRKGHDTTNNENKVNFMVYKLYKLDYSELKEVDNDIADKISKTNYDKLNFGFEYLDSSVLKEKMKSSKTKKKGKSVGTEEIDFDI